MNQVTAYADDSCGRPITEIMNYDSCERLESIYGANNLWSVW
jgi:hypothetical protein